MGIHLPRRMEVPGGLVSAEYCWEGCETKQAESKRAKHCVLCVEKIVNEWPSLSGWTFLNYGPLFVTSAGMCWLWSDTNVTLNYFYNLFSSSSSSSSKFKFKFKLLYLSPVGQFVLQQVVKYRSHTITHQIQRLPTLQAWLKTIKTVNNQYMVSQ